MDFDDKQDHDEAFERYVIEGRQRLRRAAYLMCGDWYTADDLVQTVLFKIYRQWPRLSNRTELGTYSLRVLSRVYISEFRRARWRRELQVTPPELGYRQGEFLEERLILFRALGRLGPGQRAVVVLRFWEDLTVDQVAASLGCSTGTVRSQTYRALAALRGMLGHLGPELRDPKDGRGATTLDARDG